jgi:hypothetical protein
MSATAPVSAQYRYNLLHTEATVIARLPKSAQAKLEHLRRIEGRARVLRTGLFEEINIARDNYQAAVRDLARFDSENRFVEKIVEGKRVTVPPPGRDELANWAERCKAELQRLQSEQNLTNTSFAIADIIDWLITSQSAKFIAVPVKLPKIDNLSAALQKNRDQQSALNDELIALENAPMTKAEARAAMRAAVAALGKQPDVSGLFYGQELTWPVAQLVAHGNSTGKEGTGTVVTAATVRDSFGLLIWAHPDAIIAKLDAEIERMGDDAAALSREDKAARIAEAQAKLLAAQRQQEAIVETLEAAGQQVTRTCRIPEVLLGIERA